MELRQVRYFLSLSQTLNFTEAADLNGVSQPALTKAIQRLEEEVGGPLVHRDGKHTRLSDLGRKLLGEFEAIRESEERALKLATSHAADGETTIRLGIANTIGPRPFAKVISEFLDLHPKVRIILHPIDPASTEEQILSGMLDGCLCANVNATSDKIRRTRLYDERLVAVVSEDSPLADQELVSLDELVQYPYLDRLNCEFRPGFIDEAMARGYSMRVAVQSHREDWVQQLVKAGSGVTTLAEYSSVVPGIALRPMQDVNLGRTVSLISVLGSTGNQALQALEKAASTHDWSKLTSLVES